MAIITRGGSVKKNLKFFIYGQQGTWKSTLALQLAALKKEDGSDVKLVYVDAEFGSIDNYIEDFCEEFGLNPDNILLVKCNTYDEIEKSLNTAINNEPFYIEDEDGIDQEVLDSEGNIFTADAIVLDSATVIQDTTKYGMIKTSEKRAKIKAKKRDGATATDVFVAEQTAGMEFKDYDKLNHKGKNLLRSLITKTNKMVAVISREKPLKEKVKDGKGGFETVTVGVQPDCFKDAQYEFYTVLHTYEDEETSEIYAQIERKDRTKQFEPGTILKSPSLFPWQEVINSNVGKKAIKNETKSYDEIVEAQSKELMKSKASTKVPSQTTTSATETVVEEEIDESGKTAEEVFKEIKAVRTALAPAKKAGLMAELTKNDLPKPSSKLSKDVLESILKVAVEYSK